MNKFLFGTSLLCTALACIFLWTKLSLNGYKADFYFFGATLLLNIISFWALYQAAGTRRKSFINLILAALQLIGLTFFLRIDTLQVDRVFIPQDNKANLYAAASGWYKRAYFKPHRAELCYDGELWTTKVPYYFPLIEIETSREQCHKVRSAMSNSSSYDYIPE